MKIHIIGCSGTGKTYLANGLAEKYKIPHFDLDNLQWDDSAGTYGVRMSVEKRSALLQQILELGFEKGKKETLKSLHNLLKWTDTFQNANRKEIGIILQKYEDKVYYIRSSREVRNLIRGGL